MAQITTRPTSDVIIDLTPFKIFASSLATPPSLHQPRWRLDLRKSYARRTCMRAVTRQLFALQKQYRLIKTRRYFYSDVEMFATSFVPYMQMLVRVRERTTSLDGIAN